MNEEAKIELTGSAWTLISFETYTGVIPAVKEAPATLAFSTAGIQAGRLSGSGGCNRFAGSYTMIGERLRLGPLAVTRMMCDPIRMDQEDRFLHALSTVERCTLSQGELHIVYTGGTLRFAPASSPAEGGAQL